MGEGPKPFRSDERKESWRQNTPVGYREKKVMSKYGVRVVRQVALLGLFSKLGASFSAHPLMVQASRSPSRSIRLTSISDLRSTYEITDFTNHDDLAVVCFSSSWCKACQKFQLLYRRLDASNPRGLRLANVEYSQHTALSKSYGVVKLPTVQFYHRGKRLDSFSSGPKAFARVLGTMQCLLDEIEAMNLEEGSALLQAELGRHLREDGPLASSSSPYSPLYSATSTSPNSP
jgi:thiol-disulfide isomerase/thioredoxin